MGIQIFKPKFARAGERVFETLKEDHIVSSMSAKKRLPVFGNFLSDNFPLYKFV